MAKMGAFFSVADPVKIGGTLYRPSVCYPIPGSLEQAVAELAAKGRARIYQEEVRFVTGVAYPVKKPEVKAPARVPSVPSGGTRRRSREF
jgi:hypothetical protein